MVVIHRKICRPILLIGTPHMPIFFNLFLYHDLFPDQIKAKPLIKNSILQLAETLRKYNKGEKFEVILSLIISI
jgi:hypothetical protein